MSARLYSFPHGMAEVSRYRQATLINARIFAATQHRVAAWKERKAYKAQHNATLLWLIVPVSLVALVAAAVWGK